MSKGPGARHGARLVGRAAHGFAARSHTMRLPRSSKPKRGNPTGLGFCELFQGNPPPASACSSACLRDGRVIELTEGSRLGGRRGPEGPVPARKVAPELLELAPRELAPARDGLHPVKARPVLPEDPVCCFPRPGSSRASGSSLRSGRSGSFGGPCQLPGGSTTRSALHGHYQQVIGCPDSGPRTDHPSPLHSY